MNAIQRRVGACVGCLGFVTAIALSAQGPRSASNEENLTALLNEVRALRGEVNAAAAISIRAQLLVARLQLQEQRITNLARELSDVSRRLAEAQTARAGTAATLKQSEESRQRDTEPEHVKSIEYEAKILSRRLLQEQTAEQQLQAHHVDLSASLSAEQTRWIEFNGRLDELERALPGRPPGR